MAFMVAQALTAQPLAKAEDWVRPGDPLYQALQQAAQSLGSQDPAAGDLGRQAPLPIGSARELGLSYCERPELDSALRARIRSLLPGSQQELHDSFESLSRGTQSQAKRLDLMQEALEGIQKTLGGNVYDKSSFPAVTMSFGGSYNASRWTGITAQQSGQQQAALGLDFSGGLESASYDFSLSLQQNNAIGESNRLWVINGASLFFNEGFFSGWQADFGRRAYSQLSTLIYASPGSPAKLTFFDRAGALDLSGLEPPAGERTVEGLRLWRHGQAPWWPFSNTVFVATTPEQYYQPGGRRVAEMAGRLDIEGLSLGIFQNAQPYVTGLWMGNDQAEILSYQAGAVPSEGNQAAAIGLDTQIAGGGTLVFEAATSEWHRSDLGQDFADSAFFATASKQISAFRLVLDGSQIGPRFITETQRGMGTNNWQAGSSLDSSTPDPRPGNAGRTSWETISRQPSLLVNNSKRAALRIESAWSWGKLGLGGATSTQIEPSGPWVQSSHSVGGGPSNSFDWYSLFYNGFQSLPPGSAQPGTLGGNALWAYNRPTQAAAIYNGNAYQANWNELTQKIYHNNQETLLLSQNGVGDANLRADSLKSLNSLQAGLSIDGAAIFERLLPFEITLNSEWRDTAEQARAASFAGDGLLAQGIAESAFRWGLSGECDLVGLLAYESWQSRASLFPLDYADTMWGLGFDFRLDKYLSGLKSDLRYRNLSHQDLNFAQRDFSGWGLDFETNLSF